MISLPPEVLMASKKLDEAGYENYLVGGALRDALLGRKTRDYDLATSAKPQQVRKLFKKQPLSLSGQKHGTVAIYYPNLHIDITTFRTEGSYSDFRHPDQVNYVTDIKEDLARRDFTINAMAYHPQKGLLDPYGGQSDLDHKIIRAVRDPFTRMGEDALRILRGLRFAATLSFDIEPDTARAMHAQAELLSRIAKERITMELEGLFAQEEIARTIADYPDVFRTLVPGLDFRAFVRSCEYPCAERLLRFLLLRTYSISKQSFYQAFKLSKKDQNTLELCYTNRHRLLQKEATLLQWLTIDLRDKLPLFFHYCLADASKGEFRTIKSVWKFYEGLDKTDWVIDLSDLAIRGQDLLDLGLQGEEIGHCLIEAFTAVVNGYCENEKEKLLQYLSPQYK
ncbi:MAG: hypothetical protein LBR25_04360 [Erysipelotrichaceae bacterium]|jgi:tRNA nucleotidyltransferase/poly(A) polymerase|nr:hypothetical protein [Erysipelotrichaceae bacterium]